MGNTMERNVINIIGGVFVLIIVALFVAPYFYHNDYFVDEAMLANSLFTRDFFSLSASPLDYSQSAPLGYVYLVKILAIVFGNSVAVTRFLSLAASLLTLVCTYKTTKKFLLIKYPIFIKGFVGINGLIIRFASNCKQYSTETFLVLLCLYCLGLFRFVH
ncbi:MAG: hypothetical protein LBQ88_22280 [Treponema sp.]|jgi:uncharacterized membrane protein|nr:hypothetical protein [Treponema sp.]